MLRYAYVSSGLGETGYEGLVAVECGGTRTSRPPPWGGRIARLRGAAPV